MPPINVILIRHGQREKTSSDKDSLLTVKGKQDVGKLANRLVELNISPKVFFTSKYIHARQTADSLRCHHSTSKVIEVDALTPRTADSHFTIENIIDTARENQIDLNTVDTIVLVGHESRLSQLITMMTGKRVRPLELLDVVCVKAKNLQDLMLGCADIDWRIPVKAYEEADLRAKVSSKMTVATFLAGFTFAALLQIITSTKKPFLKDIIENQATLADFFNAALPLFATLCLTAALALFIAAIYIYDRLSMPEGFWATARAPKWETLPSFVQENKDQHGLIYSYMIHTWINVFTPAVLLAAVGFFLLVLEKNSPGLTFVYLMIIIGVGLVYRNVRPQLGID